VSQRAITARRTDDVDWEAQVRGAIDGETAVRAVYQPVVDLKRRTVVGYEALARFGAPGAETFGPDTWFAAAHSVGLAAELEARVLRAAFSARPDLPGDCFLAVNVEPESLAEPVVREAFAEQGSLGGIVIEITEHRPLDLDRLEGPLAWLRGSGALVAVDDAGAGHAGLQQILTLRPSIVKLDRTLIAGIDRDEAKAALVEMLGGFANRIDAWLLAEGIETVGEARRLVDLQVPLVQGYYFARPAPQWATLAPAAVRDLANAASVPASGLHRLVDATPPIGQGDLVGLRELPPGARWTPVIDGDRRPIGLLTAEAALVGELLVGLVANVHSTPGEVAQRLSTAGPDPAAPVMVVDNAGRYLGVIPLRRILAHLGGES
jgi:EAL domain-containing protein (putative c-di-GMP-specific phosphodiesterase class I)